MPSKIMFNIGPLELLLILVVALIVVGPKRLPEVGRSIGKGLRELRKAQDEVKETLTFTMSDEPERPTQRKPIPGAKPPRPRPAEKDDATLAETPSSATDGVGEPATPDPAPKAAEE